MAEHNLAGSAKGAVARRAERDEGLAYARAWRERQRPIFDALFGVEQCGVCGR